MNTQGPASFLVDQINSEFKEISEKALALLTQHGDIDAAKEIRNTLEDQKKNALLKVVFVGQYSAGKSTVISALTGNRNIKIDADIATDKTTDYPWNGILLTDTPGLWTERPDHDTITMEAIRRADLLVFVITSDLFNTLTLTNFKKLALEDGLNHKMMLVINKMSMESGGYDVLVKNYSASIDSALHPQSITDFRCSFIDAADYLDGDPEMVELSHFINFVDGLNSFVKERGLLGRLDQPSRATYQEIENVRVMAGASENDKQFLMILQRMERRIQRIMDAADGFVKTSAMSLRAQVFGYGSRLSGMVTDPNISHEVANANVEIQVLAEKAAANIEVRLDELTDQLNEELAEIMESELADSYFRQLSINPVNIKNAEQGISPEKLSKTVSITKVGAQRLGAFFSSSGKITSGTLNATAAAGSVGHKALLSAGKFVGVKFKPWQAVNVAKGIGNALGKVTVVLSLVTGILDIINAFNDGDDPKEVIAAKNTCRNEYGNLADQLEQQCLKNWDEYKNEYFKAILTNIYNLRQEKIEFQTRQSEYQKALGALAAALKQLLEKVANTN